MAGRGPAPKPQRSRERDNVPETEITASERATDAPDLPPRSDGGTWSDYTVRWYANWAASPQSARFVVTDWQRLHALAEIVELYAARPSVSLMGEIRQNETLLGATMLDRMRLRLKIVDDPAAEKAAKRRRATRGDPRQLAAVN